MNFLVIDGAQDKIIFFSNFNNNSYHKIIKPSKNNNEKFSMVLFDFFNENSINPSKLNNIFVNQGPGKFSSIRTSIAVAKALSVVNKLNLYGFSLNDLKDANYKSVIDLYDKGMLTKNLIKPVYSS
tara:strand:- start:207 stop:584 length:378 start_codon:yes stop_codon:yes gene_type:complete